MYPPPLPGLCCGAAAVGWQCTVVVISVTVRHISLGLVLELPPG